MLETLQQTLVDKAVEKREIVRAALHHAADDMLDHRLHDLKVAVEVAERHLRLDHPELGGVALGVGVLGAERRTEGVHVAEGEREVLGVELTGHGQVRALAEEILAEIDLAVIRARQVVEVERRDAEHLARALTVRARDDRGLDVDEAAVLEERVHRLRGHAADAERRAEEVRARTQMLDRAQEFHTVALFLQRIIRRGRALERDAVGLELERLLGVRCEHELAVHDERRTDVLAGDLVVIFELAALKHDLQALEAAAVVELDKAEILHVADRARPAADGQGLAAEGLRGCIDAGDVLSFHIFRLVFDGFYIGNSFIIRICGRFFNRFCVCQAMMWMAAWLLLSRTSVVTPPASPSRVHATGSWNVKRRFFDCTRMTFSLS